MIFSRWPPFGIGNIFINTVQHCKWNGHCFSMYQASCQQLIYFNYYDCLKYFIEIQRTPFLIWPSFPPISIFRLGPQLKMFCMTYTQLLLCNISCFYHLLNYFFTDRLDQYKKSSYKMLKKILRFHSQLKNQNHNCTLVCKIKVFNSNRSFRKVYNNQ